MRQIRRLEPIVAPPVVARMVARLRVDLGSEHLLSDHRDTQLDPLGHIGLEEDRAVADRARVAHVAPGDDLGIADKVLPETDQK